MDHAILRTLTCTAAAVAVVASVAAVGAGGVEGQQNSADAVLTAPVFTAPVFTAQQATAGKAVYAKSCASCHMPDLSGSNEMPPLAGTAFLNTWGARSTKELFDYLSASMPYGAPSLTTEAYTSVTAYILESNGGVAGPDALSASTGVAIRSVARARRTAGQDR